jgi:hypothetical protein
MIIGITDDLAAVYLEGKEMYKIRIHLKLAKQAILPIDSLRSDTQVTAAPDNQINLTPVQRQVLLAYCEPMFQNNSSDPASHRQAGERLRKSPNTARNQIQEIVRRMFDLGVLSSGADIRSLCLWAVRHGIVSSTDLNALPPVKT